MTISLQSRWQSYFWYKKPEYFFWGAFVLAVFLFFFASGKGAGEKTRVLPERAIMKNPFQEITLEASAAVVLDARTKRAFFEKDASARLPLASLTKIMTAATALSLIPETTLIPIDMNALREEGDSGLSIGEEWLLRDLLQLMLLESSNDGAHAVASMAGAVALGLPQGETGRSFFIERMNGEAKRIGLTTLFFSNETGLDVSPTLSGGYGSARDVALLFSGVLSRNPSIFEVTKQDGVSLWSNSGGELYVKNTNRETERFPLLLASKTGYTDLAGGNLALAFDAGFNRPIVIVVLGSTVEGRFADAEKLVWATLQYLTNNQ